MRSQPVLREQLNAAHKGAAEADDKCALGIIRLIQAALQERDLHARSHGQPEGLSDAEIGNMLQAMVDQRLDSTRRYEESGQLELAAREADEIDVIKRFLPPQLDDAACAEAIGRVITDLKAEKLKDTGRVITELKNRYPGQMDFTKARRLICRRLG